MSKLTVKKIEPKNSLSYYERQIIETRFRGKWKIRKIARHFSRSPSIISQEIKRNIHPSGKYMMDYAQSAAEKRTHKTNKRKMDTDSKLSFLSKKAGDLSHSCK